jgi:hypothetical protein
MQGLPTSQSLSNELCQTSFILAHWIFIPKLKYSMAPLGVMSTDPKSSPSFLHLGSTNLMIQRKGITGPELLI